MMFAQMHTKKGIKLFDERAISSMINEFKHVDGEFISVNMVVTLTDA